MHQAAINSHARATAFFLSIELLNLAYPNETILGTGRSLRLLDDARTRRKQPFVKKARGGWLLPVWRAGLFFKSKLLLAA